MREADSALATRLWWSASEPLTSRTAYPEGRAALAAAHRDRRISKRQLRDAAASLDRMLSECDVIELEEAVSVAAGELAEEQGLRGGDAIHLASALTRAQAAPALATWDAQLRRAALTVGLAVAP